MEQTDQFPDTRSLLLQYIEELQFIDLVGIADMVSTQFNVLHRYMEGKPSFTVEKRVIAFLNGDGARFLELTKALKTARVDRVALHQERAAILRKARTHKTINRFYKSENTPDLRNQRVPSPEINN